MTLPHVPSSGPARWRGAPLDVRRPRPLKRGPFLSHRAYGWLQVAAIILLLGGAVWASSGLHP